MDFEKKIETIMKKSLKDNQEKIAGIVYPGLNFEKIASFQTKFIMTILKIISFTTFILTFTYYFPTYLGWNKDIIIIILLSLILLHLKTNTTKIKLEE